MGMKRSVTLILCLVAMLRAAPQSDIVKVELLADVAKVKPGETFTVGAMFRVKPGWHIYWKNPGDAGLATSVKFVAPAGFSVGSLRWPVPIKFNQPGNIVGYGYTDSLLLSAKVKAPAKLSPGSSVTIRAQVAWLACEKVCIPGQASLELTLPVGATATPANRDVVAPWEKRLPIDAGSVGSPLTARITGTISAEAAPAPFTVTLQWKSPVTQVDWFPTDEKALSIENIACKTEGRQTSITFTATLLRGLKLSTDVLDTLVVYSDASGQRKGITLPIRLRASSKQKGA